MDVDALKALADENRLGIVRLLADGERCVCELASALELSDALVSHHVKRLADAGLVRTRRVGRWLHCSLATDALTSLGAELAETGSRAAEAEAARADQDPGCGACVPAVTTDRKAER